MDSLIVNQNQLADGCGMCYLNDKFVWWDTLHHVNKQGFLSKFDYTPAVVDSMHKCGKKIVMIIGDSFLEGGVSLTRQDSLFPEMLNNIQCDYLIMPFGVGGTDPLNYRLIAEKFIPQLKPDIVIVSFCGNNDFMFYDRKPTPNIPVYWQTNAGGLSSVAPHYFSGSYDMVLNSPSEAYNFYIKNTDLTRTPGLMGWMIKHSYLASSLYFGLKIRYNSIKAGNMAADDISYRHLHIIDSICSEEKIPFAIAFAPDNNHIFKTKADYIARYKAGFKDLILKVYFPVRYSESDYIPGDIHFNEKGNEKFALFVQGILGEISNENSRKRLSLN
ncbi:MAG: hypothetical protein ACHP6H_02855 [Legionellales bacterium]